MASITPALHQTHDLPGKSGLSAAERRTLRRIPLLHSLSNRELEDVHKRMLQRSYLAGEVIWRTRRPLGWNGYVQNGEIVLETWIHGVLVRGTRLDAGDLLPPHPLQNHRPHETVIARAITDVHLVILPEMQKQSVVKHGGGRGINWFLPVLLLLLVIVLARDDIARITSGLFYMVSTQGGEAALQDTRSMRLLEAAQTVDRGAAFAYNEQGYRWFLQDKLPDASAAFNEAVTRDPASAPALNNLAITYFIQGDLARAARYLQQAMEQDPDNSISRYNLGITLLQLGDPPGALREFREAGFIDPQAASAFLQQAFLYQQAGEYANAEQRARSAIQLNPSFIPAHLLLGMALYQQGREVDALTSFAEALVLEPDNRVAAFYQALILGHQKQYDAALPVLHELLASSSDAAETARILAELDALYRFKAEPAATGP